MHLFVSDLHLGRHDPATDRRVESDLIALLDTVDDELEGVFLLGDIFDYFIEYRSVVPRGFVRLQAALASLTDRSVPVTYLVGNHDPWHDRYFREELGVRIVHDFLRVRLGPTGVYAAHGDRLVEHGLVRRAVERLLRHPIPVWLYKALIPADVGIFLARKSSRTLASRAPEVQPEVVEELRNAARRELERTETDLVILAHTHFAEAIRWPVGDYINTGCWYRDRTFARLGVEGADLCRWRDGAIEMVSMTSRTSHVEA